MYKRWKNFDKRLYRRQKILRRSQDRREAISESERVSCRLLYHDLDSGAEFFGTMRPFIGILHGEP